MRKIALYSLVLVGLALISLTSCRTGDSRETLVGGSMSGALDETAAGATMGFVVDVEQAGDPVGIDFRGVLVSGSVRVQLVDTGLSPVFLRTVDQPGAFEVNSVVYPAPGTYTFGLAWEGPVTIAQYEVQWKPHPIVAAGVSPLALLGGAGMVGVAVAYLAYAGRNRLGWRYLGFGALAWLLTVALKFVWAVPLNTPVYKAITAALPEPVAMLVFIIYVGLLTGLTEVLLTWLVVRYTRLGQVPWGKALAFGIGFGAVEALLLGIGSLGNVAAALVMPELLPLQALAQLAAANNPLWGLAPIVERFFTCLIHIFCNGALFYGARKRATRWFWLSFFFKSAIDAVAAWGQLRGLDSLGKIWALEAVVVVFGGLAWWGTRWISVRYPVSDAQ